MESRPEAITRLRKTYAPGEPIFHAGEKGSHMYIVHDGSVDILAGTGERKTCLASIAPGSFFGEMALVDKSPRTATAVAGAQGATVLAIDRTHFVYLVSQQPAFALVVMEALITRLRGNSGAAPLAEAAA